MRARCSRPRSPPESCPTGFCWSAPRKLKRARGARRHFEPPHFEDVLPARDVLEYGFSAASSSRDCSTWASFTVLPIEILPESGFSSRDHAKERRLAGAVRTDDADDGAGRHLERKLVDEQPIAVALRHVLELDDLVAEALGDGNEDLLGFITLLVLVLGELLEARKPRLGLRAAPLGFWRTHSSSACMALMRAASWLASAARRFSAQPAGVVALPRNAVAAVELEDPARGIVEK